MLFTLLYIIIGLLIGYLVGSYVESFFHQYVSDAPTKLYKFYRRYPRIFSAFISTYYSHHIIHHYHTYKSHYTTQFSSDEEEQKLQIKLAKKGSHGQLIIDSAYAVKLGGRGIVKYLVALALLLPLCYLLFNKLIFAGICITVWLPAIMAHWVHPYMHMSKQDVKQNHGSFINWLINTRYMRNVAINHFIHHKYGGVSNYNLVLGGDILRRISRKATAEDFREMKTVGLI